MAFKTMVDYDNERYHDMLMLRDDGDYVDVILLYQDIKDVIVCDSHYIKGPNFNGYVQCLGKPSCPACNYGENGIYVQTKLFIPVYVVSNPNGGKDEGEILFWDRNVSFNQQVLDPQVFSKYPDPSQFVFRITRSGARGDANTRYNIQAIGKNNLISYEDILKEKNIKMPDYYETICKDWSVEDYNKVLNKNQPVDNFDADTMPNYTLKPREMTPESELPDFSSIDETSDNEGSDDSEALPDFV